MMFPEKIMPIGDFPAMIDYPSRYIPLNPIKSHCLLMVSLGDLHGFTIATFDYQRDPFFLDLKMSQTRLPLQEIVLEPAPKDPGSKLFDEAWPLEEIFTTNT